MYSRHGTCTLLLWVACIGPGLLVAPSASAGWFGRIPRQISKYLPERGAGKIHEDDHGPGGHHKNVKGAVIESGHNGDLHVEHHGKSGAALYLDQKEKKQQKGSSGPNESAESGTGSEEAKTKESFNPIRIEKQTGPRERQKIVSNWKEAYEAFKHHMENGEPIDIRYDGRDSSQGYSGRHYTAFLPVYVENLPLVSGEDRKYARKFVEVAMKHALARSKNGEQAWALTQAIKPVAIRTGQELEVSKVAWEATVNHVKRANAYVDSRNESTETMLDLTWKARQIIKDYPEHKGKFATLLTGSLNKVTRSSDYAAWDFIRSLREMRQNGKLKGGDPEIVYGRLKEMLKHIKSRFDGKAAAWGTGSLLVHAKSRWKKVKERFFGKHEQTHQEYIDDQAQQALDKLKEKKVYDAAQHAYNMKKRRDKHPETRRPKRYDEILKRTEEHMVAIASETMAEEDYYEHGEEGHSKGRGKRWVAGAGGGGDSGGGL